MKEKLIYLVVLFLYSVIGGIFLALESIPLIWYAGLTFLVMPVLVSLSLVVVSDKKSLFLRWIGLLSFPLLFSWWFIGHAVTHLENVSHFWYIFIFVVYLLFAFNCFYVLIDPSDKKEKNIKEEEKGE